MDANNRTDSCCGCDCGEDAISDVIVHEYLSDAEMAVEGAVMSATTNREKDELLSLYNHMVLVKTLLEGEA